MEKIPLSFAVRRPVDAKIINIEIVFDSKNKLLHKPIKNNTKERIDIAKKKCLTKFRQLISGINNRIETTQIYQCDNRWGEIDFEKKVTSITMKKQSKAFLYTNKHTTEYNSEYYDRMKCSENYKNYITKSVNNKTNI